MLSGREADIASNMMVSPVEQLNVCAGKHAHCQYHMMHQG